MRIMRDKIMRKIKEGNIKMKPSFYFWMRKAGLESLLAFFVVFGAIALNSLLYFIKKKHTIDFLFFGWTGLEKFLGAFPYDYMVLLIISILLANFLIRKFDLSYGIVMNTNMALLFLLVITLSISSFFLVNGIEDVLSHYSKDGESAREIILGRVKEFSDKEAVIQEAGDQEWKIIIEASSFGENGGVSCGKDMMMRVMGREKDKRTFYADEIMCY